VTRNGQSANLVLTALREQLSLRTVAQPGDVPDGVVARFCVDAKLIVRETREKLQARSVIARQPKGPQSARHAMSKAAAGERNTR
jgi:hypothetical protein